MMLHSLSVSTQTVTMTFLYAVKYAAMCIKTHLNSALYQITAVCFEHVEHKLVITVLQLVSN